MKKPVHRNRYVSSFLTASFVVLGMSSISNLAFAGNLNECEPNFDPSWTEVSTKIESELVSLDKSVVQKPSLDRNAVDFFPANTSFHVVKFQEWKLPKSSKDADFQPALSDLLDMLTETHFENIDTKMTIEKGEMHLARPIGDGQSVEFEYRRDLRSDAFQLDKVVLYKPNGQGVTLDKSPLSDSGLHLLRDSAMFVESTEIFEGRETLASLRPLEIADLAQWSEGKPVLEAIVKKAKGGDPVQTLSVLSPDLSSSDRERLEKVYKNSSVLKVPLRIGGDLLKEITIWAKRMPDLPRGSVKAAIKNHHITRLVWSARLTSSVKLMMSTVRKQSAKWILMGAVIVGLQQSPAVYNHVREFIPQRFTTQILHGNGRSLDESQLAEINQLLTRLQASAPEAVDGKLITPIQVKTGSTQANLLQSTSDLPTAVAQFSTKEKAAGGSMVFYVSDLTNHQGPQKIGSETFQSAQSQVKSGYLIAVFQKTQKMIFAPINQIGQSTQTNLSTILIDRHGNEVIYDLIAASLIRH